MFDIDITRDHGRALLRLIGSIAGQEDHELLIEAFAFVRGDDHLVLDLTYISSLDRTAANFLHDTIVRRSTDSESVIVSPGERVSLPLVLQNVDRVTSIVRTMEQAVAVLDCRGAGERLREPIST